MRSFFKCSFTFIWLLKREDRNPQISDAWYLFLEKQSNQTLNLFTSFSLPVCYLQYLYSTRVAFDSLCDCMWKCLFYVADESATVWKILLPRKHQLNFNQSLRSVVSHMLTTRYSQIRPRPSTGWPLGVCCFHVPRGHRGT